MNNEKYEALKLDDFLSLLHYFKRTNAEDNDLLYELYSDCVELLNMHQEAYENIPFTPLEHSRLVLFLLFDFDFRLYTLTHEEKIVALDDDAFYGKLVNAVVDKYGSYSYFKYDEGSLISGYATEISTINVYVNFILLKLKVLQFSSNDDVLFADLLKSAFSLCRTITDLLKSGFEKEALSSWRSLHELEATLVVLDQHKPLLTTYRRHILYNATFNKLIDPNEGDQFFAQMKEEMRALQLKSKDIRRYIEYGWIKDHPSFNIEIHRFNFRDGVETLAGLTEAREDYQVASEVAHSSPLMLFGDRHYFLRLTLLRLYSSFLSIERLFAAIYTQNTTEDEKQYYLQIRKLYLEDIDFVVYRISGN